MTGEILPQTRTWRGLWSSTQDTGTVDLEQLFGAIILTQKRFVIRFDIYLLRLGPLRLEIIDEYGSVYTTWIAWTSSRLSGNGGGSSRYRASRRTTTLTRRVWYSASRSMHRRCGNLCRNRKRDRGLVAGVTFGPTVARVTGGAKAARFIRRHQRTDAADFARRFVSSFPIGTCCGVRSR